MNIKKVCVLLAVISLLAVSVAANAGNWTAFGYRNGATVTDMGSGVYQFNVGSGGLKAAWGTNDIDGKKLSDITNISITRVTTDGIAPYLNLWIADTYGKHAILAVNLWSMDWNAMKSQTAYIYEAETGFANPGGTIESFADYIIGAPAYGAPSDYMTWLMGTRDYKAPYDYVNQKGYGVNWVFGDSANNYVGVFQASNPIATAVPEPSSILALFGGLISLIGIRRRRS